MSDFNDVSSQSFVYLRKVYLTLFIWIITSAVGACVLPGGWTIFSWFCIIVWRVKGNLKQARGPDALTTQDYLVPPGNIGPDPILQARGPDALTTQDYLVPPGNTGLDPILQDGAPAHPLRPQAPLQHPSSSFGFFMLAAFCSGGSICSLFHLLFRTDCSLFVCYLVQTAVPFGVFAVAALVREHTKIFYFDRMIYSSFFLVMLCDFIALDLFGARTSYWWLYVKPCTVVPIQFLWQVVHFKAQVGRAVKTKSLFWYLEAGVRTGTHLSVVDECLTWFTDFPSFAFRLICTHVCDFIHDNCFVCWLMGRAVVLLLQLIWTYVAALWHHIHSKQDQEEPGKENLQ